MSLRTVKFKYLHKNSISSNRIFVSIKTILYFVFGIIMLWMATISRSLTIFAFSLSILSFGIISAIFNKSSCSLEAKVVLSIMALISSIWKLGLGREVKRWKFLSLGAIVIGLLLFTLSIFTLFGFNTPLAILGVYGLMISTLVAAMIEIIGFFVFLFGIFGNVIKKRGRK
ncbi:MAG: hypothetical protein LM582_00875 [Desulfurococcaceae archaeon]|nr:hypothetical protein [Desulfurococcaceae archaeon]